MSQRPKQHYLVVVDYTDQGGSFTKMAIVYGRDSDEATELGAKELDLPVDRIDAAFPLSSQDAYVYLRCYFRRSYIKRLISCCDYKCHWTFCVGSIP